MEEIEVRSHLINEFSFIESIKALRTNIMFSGENIKAVALTSCSKDEGKSTISFYLACSLAESGKRVLFVESDLRCGRMQHTLHVRDKVVGLSNFLSGAATLEEIIATTNQDGLDMIFSGTRVVNSSELLESSHFDELINTAKEQYDYIIVDAAPLGEIIDCAVIAPRVDGVIMVIDVKKNNYKLERRIKNQLEMSGGKILGVVLNKVDSKSNSGYYSRSYYNRKDYSYGYAPKNTEEKNH